ncbi:MAG: hypothetical protein IH820_15100 [Bacteroidetes bacterium]|nr:hypothetical protein [Bacteroidota bacterium]
MIQDEGNIVGDAYHGTDAANVESIQANGFTVGRSRDLFLGDGIYFYQGSQREAYKWAENLRQFQNIVVFKARINMGRCLDLDAWEHRELLEALETEILESRVVDEVPLPVAINMLSEYWSFDTVKKTQQKKKPAAPFFKSPVYSYTRTYIAVRNPARIADYKPIGQT